MSRLTPLWREPLAWWDRFWFSPQPLLNLAYFRIILCVTLFLMYFSRQFDLATFYTNAGLLPESMARSVMPEFYRPPLTWAFWGDAYVLPAHTFLIVGLALLALGIGGRVLNLLVWVVSIGFLQRNYALAFGADLIGNIFLFLMAGTQSCARLSAWHWVKPRLEGQACDLVTSVFYRMIQVQLCVVYTYTGFEKLKGQSWWDGTALWTVFANPQMVVMDFSFVRHFPLLVVIPTFLTVLFESYFAVLIWIRKIRPGVMITGLFFHLTIGASMALFSFSFVMLAPYVLWINSEALARFTLRMRRVRVAASPGL